MRNRLTRATARAAVLGASAALAAAAAPAAFAQGTAPAEGARVCVLKAGGGADCGGAAQRAAAARGRSRCTSTRTTRARRSPFTCRTA
ncbi:hypothetical protein [Actinomadura madurae]|uniref:hypothetical protein n=1 Tax=Actinomadura madurae TaxID=1993 RepID=UPI0020D23F58|nr:hypothetical protein [Actinomadura madurae]MCP9964808.1 hypothetical protein [Actinomadura madurae]MCP9977290.1 hypothetical protein [Actinomadura madurae]MCQ0011200.1 hypothetical protein [Actinomadura madurae]